MIQGARVGFRPIGYNISQRESAVYGRVSLWHCSVALSQLSVVIQGAIKDPT